MNKKLFCFIVLVLFSRIVFSQSAINGGTKIIGIGTGTLFPFYFSVDYGLNENLTFGFEYATKELKDDYYLSKYYLNGLTGMFNYHFNNLLYLPKKWDLYSGVNAAYYWSESPWNYYDSYSYTIGAQIGFRYFFYKGLGLNVELITRSIYIFGEVGLSIKF